MPAKAELAVIVPVVFMKSRRLPDIESLGLFIADILTLQKVVASTSFIF